MDVLHINFCNLAGYLIQNKRSKSDIIRSIQKKYNIDIFNIYTNYYSDKIIPQLKTRQIYSCFMTKGKKYMLYLTKIFNENTSILIELNPSDGINYKVIVVNLSIDDSLFNDTLFYGEMIKHSNNWTFLIETCHVHMGKNTKNKPHVDIISLCQEFFNSFVYNINITPFDIKIKKYFTISNINNNLRNEKHNYMYTGIKFYGLRSPTIFTFHRHTTMPLNIRLLEELSIDIRQDKQNLMEEYLISDSTELVDINFQCSELSFTLIMKPSDIPGIYNVFSSTLRNIGISRIKTFEMNLMFENHFKNNTECIVSTFYNNNFDKWEILNILSPPQRISDEKTINSKLHIKL